MIPRTKSLRRGPGPQRKAGVKRGGRIKPKPRSAAEYARIYHSPERVRFVQVLDCLVSWCREWPSDNHHIENGGMSRKADYTKIVPLCEIHHEQCHHIGRETFERIYGLDLERAAAETEKKWQAHNPPERR